MGYTGNLRLDQESLKRFSYVMYRMKLTNRRPPQRADSRHVRLLLQYVALSDATGHVVSLRGGLDCQGESVGDRVVKHAVGVQRRVCGSIRIRVQSRPALSGIVC